MWRVDWRGDGVLSVLWFLPSAKGGARCVMVSPDKKVSIPWCKQSQTRVLHELMMKVANSMDLSWIFMEDLIIVMNLIIVMKRHCADV